MPRLFPFYLTLVFALVILHSLSHFGIVMWWLGLAFNSFRIQRLESQSVRNLNKVFKTNSFPVLPMKKITVYGLQMYSSISTINVCPNTDRATFCLVLTSST